MGGSGNTVNKNEQYTANPLTQQGAAGTYDWLNKAYGQDYTTGMPVQQYADFNPDQEAAFASMRGAQGMSNPYFQAAQDYLKQGTGPVSTSDINQYFDPYYAQQMSALNNALGADTAQTKARAIAGGGGGSAERIGVELANKMQADQRARGQLASDTYGKALSAAQQDKQRYQSASALSASMGPAALQARMQELGGLYNMGSQQQQLSQAQLDAMYKWNAGKFQYPAYLAQLGAGITGGLGGVLGGNKTGQTIYPETPWWSQMANLGIAGAGAAGKIWGNRGGRIPGGYALGGYAGGGVGPNAPDSFWDELDKGGPQLQKPGQQGGGGGGMPFGLSKDALQTGMEGTGAFLPDAAQDFIQDLPETIGAGAEGLGSGIMEGLSGAGEWLGGLGAGLGEWLGGLGAAGAGETAAELAPLLLINTGGRIPGPYRAAGGTVSPIPYVGYAYGGGFPRMRGYDEGGEVENSLFPASIWDYDNLLKKEPLNPKFPDALPQQGESDFIGPSTPPPSGSSNLSQQDVSFADPKTGETIDMPRIIAEGPPGSSRMPRTASAYGPSGDTGEELVGTPPVRDRTAARMPDQVGLPPMPTIPEMPKRGKLGGGDIWDFLLHAGVSGLANSGRRDQHGLPIGGGGFGQLMSNTGIGLQGGLKYGEERHKQDIEEWRNQVQAQELLEKAGMARAPYLVETAGVKRGHDIQQETAKREERKLALEEMKPVQIGWDSLMRPIFAKRDPKTGEYVDPKTGKPIVSTDKNSETKTESGEGTPVRVGKEEIVPGKNVGAHVNLDILRENPDMAATLVGLSRGEINIATIPQRNNYRAAVIEAVKRFDPTWDQLSYGRRQKAWADLSSNGNAGKLMMATNQLLPHLGTAMKKAVDLDNQNVLAGNVIKNWWQTNIEGDPRVKSFETVREVAAMDAARLLRGSGAMAEKDIEFWRANLSSSGSPRQLAENIRLLADDLMEARYGSIAHQFEIAAGHPPPKDLRSPEAIKALEGIREAAAGVEERDKKKKTPATAPAQQPPTKQLSPADQQMLDWANKNPGDRAKRIKERLGVP